MPHLIIFSVLLICGLLVSCVLTSCQPLVQPFRPEEKTESDAMFTMRDAGGIVIRRVDGLPAGAAPALVESLVESLQRLEIPATTLDAGSNKRSLFLDGQASTRLIDGDRLAVAIDWRLTDADGRMVGRPKTTMEVTRAAWGLPGPQPYAMLGERAVAGIAALVQDPTTVAVAAPAPEERRLFLRPVAGAPGNGGPELSRAMDSALRTAQLPVTDRAEDAALVIAGSVHVAPPERGRQHVEILWRVLDPAGQEIAKLAQNNAVDAGSLDGDWSGIAPLIAQAVVPGIVDMLRQVPPRAEIPAPRSGG